MMLMILDKIDLCKALLKSRHLRRPMKDSEEESVIPSPLEIS